MVSFAHDDGGPGVGNRAGSSLRAGIQGQRLSLGLVALGALVLPVFEHLGIGSSTVGVGLCRSALAEEDPGRSPIGDLRAKQDEMYGVTPELQAKIDARLRDGLAHMLGTQQKSGSWQSLFKSDMPLGGQHWLMVYALLEAGGADPTGEAIKRAMASEYGTKTRHMEGAYKGMYSHTCRVLALSSWIKALHRLPDSYRHEREIKGAFRTIAEDVDYFRSTQSTLGWRYPGPWPGEAQTEDMSVTQYVLLALRVARQATELPRVQKKNLAKEPAQRATYERSFGKKLTLGDDHYVEVLKYLFRDRHPTGKPYQLYWLNSDDRYQEFFRAGKPVRPVGWPYKRGSEATRAMTSAGLTCLGISIEQLRRSGFFDKSRTRIGAKERKLFGVKTRGELYERLVKEALGGWAYLSDGFRLSARVGRDRYYDIYGLERVGALFGLPNMGKHRWYPEGARWLLSQRLPDGEDGHIKLSFEMLFLKRATTPPSLPIIPPTVTRK